MFKIIRIIKNKIINKDLFIIILLFVTTINIICFFYIKNSTHYLKIQINQLSSDIISEKNSLSIQQTELNKKYGTQNLQQLVQNKLKLQLSNVKQIASVADVFEKKR